MIEVYLETDIDSTVTLAYGSDEADLNLLSSESSGKNKHTFLLENLDIDTQYFFKGILASTSGIHPETALYHIRTSQPVTPSEICNSEQIEGTIVFSGAIFSEGKALLNCDNTISIVDAASQNTVTLNLNNLQISSPESIWQ